MCFDFCTVPLLKSFLKYAHETAICSYKSITHISEKISYHSKCFDSLPKLDMKDLHVPVRI